MTDNIRVIASDFDGTILKDGAQYVDEAYFPLIRELKSMGISFIAASGRFPGRKSWCPGRILPTWCLWIPGSRFSCGKR